MSLRTVSAVLPMLLLAGCWPYLGSPYEDYVDGEGTTDPDVDTDTLPDRGTDDPDPDTDDPDTSEIGDGPTFFGLVSNIQLLGGYWGQEPNLVVQSSLIAAGEPGLRWTLTDSQPAAGTCTGGTSLGDVAASLAIDAGLPTNVAVQGSGFALGLTPWEEDARVRIGSNNGSTVLPANVAVSMTTSVDDGSVSGTLTRTPSDFDWTEPQVDGAQMLVYPREPFNVLWEGTGGDTVIATWLYQDSDFQTLGGAICNVTTGGFSIDGADTPDGTEFIELRVSRIREFGGSMSGNAGAESRVASSLDKRGYIALEAATPE